MTEQAQAVSFQVYIGLTPDGRVELRAQGNLNPAFVYAQLGMLMRELEQQMKNPAASLAQSRTPQFNIRRMP